MGEGGIRIVYVNCDSWYNGYVSLGKEYITCDFTEELRKYKGGELNYLIIDDVNEYELLPKRLFKTVAEIRDDKLTKLIG